MTEMITNVDDTIDSRDVAYCLKVFRQAKNLDEWTQEELEALEDLNKAGLSACKSWENGVMLIRDSYLETYAEELAEDIGAINPDAVWPVNCIDWEKAAEQLKQDYTSVDFEGETYWRK